jgi:hypothetical protein
MGQMRKGIAFVVCMALGALLLVLLAHSNPGLAAAVGMGLGAMVFTFVQAYPDDIAPPSDRRHERWDRRRALQRESLR